MCLRGDRSLWLQLAQGLRWQDVLDGAGGIALCRGLTLRNRATTGANHLLLLCQRTESLHGQALNTLTSAGRQSLVCTDTGNDLGKFLLTRGVSDVTTHQLAVVRRLARQAEVIQYRRCDACGERGFWSSEQIALSGVNVRWGQLTASTEHIHLLTEHRGRATHGAEEVTLSTGLRECGIGQGLNATRLNTLRGQLGRHDDGLPTSQISFTFWRLSRRRDGAIGLNGDKRFLCGAGASKCRQTCTDATTPEETFSAGHGVVVKRAFTSQGVIRTNALQRGLWQFSERLFNTTAQELAACATDKTCAGFTGQELRALTSDAQRYTLDTTKTLQQRSRNSYSSCKRLVLDTLFALARANTAVGLYSNRQQATDLLASSNT